MPESWEDSLAKLQRIQNRYRGMFLGQERNDWTARTASELQKYVPWVWSDRRGKWMQETCIGALVCTDPAGRNEQRRITASGERGSFPEELNEVLAAVGFTQVPLDNDWVHAEVRGLSWVKRSGLQLQAMGAGFEVCHDCDDMIRREGIKPSTVTKRQADGLRRNSTKRSGLPNRYDPPAPPGGPKR
jgi:hypothetical protein